MYYSKPSNRPRSQGILLIEIVAALVLAGGVLVFVLAAYAGAERQERSARKRLAAVEIAERLLSEWHAKDGPAHLPKADRSLVEPVADAPGWTWMLQPVHDPRKVTPDNPFSLQTYELSILSPPRSEQPAEVELRVEFVASISAAPMEFLQVSEHHD